ncbi:hypothetical protein [Mesorhizobium sp. LSJC264A00]|uniref:hypothetical protein n=1 Tax=unclassified Mesorhizobium TaxID=325217 RepID=UPI0012EB5FD0|nr:hypothetical protein [Mesorhizobium sp. LSJC264A00]
MAIRCLVKIENEASMWTFASTPVIGDWVHMPSGDSLAIYAVTEITHAPQPADVEKVPLVFVTLEST